MRFPSISNSLPAPLEAPEGYLLYFAIFGTSRARSMAGLCLLGKGLFRIPSDGADRWVQAESATI